MPSTAAMVRTVLVTLLTALGVLFSLYLLYRLESVIQWIVVAIFFAVALNPTVNVLRGRGVPRLAAILLVFLAVIIALLIIATLAVPPLIAQVKGIANVLGQPGGLSNEVQKLAQPFGLGAFAQTLRPQIDALPGQLSGAVGSFTSVTASAVNTVAAVVTIVVLIFFFLRDGASLVSAGLNLFPEAQRPRLRRLLDGSANAVSGYITGNLAISLIAGAGAFVGMTILGVPYALALALLLAIFDLIPMVGAQLGAIPPILAAFAISPVKALILLIYIIVYQQIETNVLNPLFYGRSVHLPPLAVFLAVLIGGVLMGILGALIAIPVAEILRLIIGEVLAGRRPSTAPPSGEGGVGIGAVTRAREPASAS
jgi:predicted PurR-regulated permease PerM